MGVLDAMFDESVELVALEKTENFLRLFREMDALVD